MTQNTIQDSTQDTSRAGKVNPDGSGIWLVDKPTDWSSHDVVNKVRGLTGIRRVGHAGTLDPLATGLLIVLVGREFTKLQSQYLKADKEYECVAQLGVVSDTYDSTGEVTEVADWERLSQISRDDVEEALEQFRGSITQQVPAYSAVKVKGRKLYAMSRNQEELPELPSREVEIKELSLMSFDRDLEAKTLKIKIKVFCSSGTYIRSLVHDLGQVLGVGGMVTELRRTKIGELSLEGAVDVRKVAPI